MFRATAGVPAGSSLNPESAVLLPVTTRVRFCRDELSTAGSFPSKSLIAGVGIAVIGVGAVVAGLLLDPYAM